MNMRITYIICLILAASLVYRCERFEVPFEPHSAIEDTIRTKYDGMAVFTWGQYESLLNKLSESKFRVLPLNEMRNTFDNSKVVVGLRHDVDNNPFKAVEMSRIEARYGIRSTYFLLATAEYFGGTSGFPYKYSREMGRVARDITSSGAEIGIHNDLLTVMIMFGLDPFEFNKIDLAFYRNLGIKIHGTASHGSYIAKHTVPNFQIFSDFAKSDSVAYEGKKYPLGEHSLADYGFEYEAYFIDYDLYFSDSGGKWNQPGGLNGILMRLDTVRPGDRIQILAHPDWWGKDF